LCRTGEPGPAHLRHHEVGDHEVHLTIRAVQQCEGRRAILGLEHVVSLRAKDARQQLPHARLIVHHEHAFVAATRGLRFT